MPEETELRLSFKGQLTKPHHRLDLQGNYCLFSSQEVAGSKTHYHCHNHGATIMAAGFKTDSYSLQSKPVKAMPYHLPLTPMKPVT